MLLAQSNNFLLNSYKLVPSIVGFMKIIVMGLRFCCGNVCGKYIYVQVIKQPPALTVVVRCFDNRQLIIKEGT